MAENLDGIFVEDRTTLADIEAAGWYVYRSSSGSWWWVGHETDAEGNRVRRLRQSVPLWIRQLIQMAEKRGEETCQMAMRQAMGLEGKDGR